MKIPKQALMALIFLGLGLLLGTRIKCNPDEPDNPVQTDSIPSPTPYEKPVTPKKAKPKNPRKVVNYAPQENPGYVIYDSSGFLHVVDSLRGEIQKIKEEYLVNYPGASKILYGSFKKDSLRLDLLKIDGEIYSDIYTVDYNKFDYIYDEGVFKEIPRKAEKHKIQSQNSVFTQYSVIQNQFGVGLEKTWTYRNIYAQVAAIGYVQDNTGNLEAQGRLGIHFNGQGRNRK